MKCTVNLHRRAAKQIRKLPKDVKATLLLLARDLETYGPSTSGIWKNYGKLKCKKGSDKRHCHIAKGKPTYVCCWEVQNNELKIMEIYYASPHEKAPY